MAINEQIGVEIVGEGGQLKKTLGDLEKDLQGFEKALKSAGSVDALAQATKGIQATKLAMSQLNGVAARSSGYNNAAAQSLNNLSRVAQDAPFGFIGIANNLNPLLESFQRLRAESGSNASALKALGSTLIGPAGLGLAIGVVSSLLVKYGDRLGELFNSTTKAEQAQKRLADLFSNAGSGFKEAFVRIGELRNNVDLAKKGFIDKELVVNQFNKTIGETVGKVKTLDEAEASLVKNGDAYIRMMLLKSAANVALGKAAEAAFKAEETRRKKESEFASFSDDIGKTRGTVPDAPGDLDAAIEAQAKEKQRKRRAAAVAEIEANKRELENIAKMFNADAAAISKTMKFDPFDGKYDPKTPKDIKAKVPKLELDVLGPLVLRVKDVQFVGGKISSLDKILGDQELQDAINRRNATGDQPVSRNPINMGQLPSFGMNEAFANAEKLKLAYEKLGVVGKMAADSIGNAFASVAQALFNGENALKAFGQSIVQSFSQVIQQLLKTAALAAAISLISGGAGALSGNGMSFLTAFKTLSGVKIPGMAQGGIIPPGYEGDKFLARLNSNEAVIPLDRLDQYTNNGGGSGYLATAKLTGRMINLMVSRENNSQRRLG